MAHFTAHADLTYIRRKEHSIDELRDPRELRSRIFDEAWQQFDEIPWLDEAEARRRLADMPQRFWCSEHSEESLREQDRLNKPSSGLSQFGFALLMLAISALIILLAIGGALIRKFEAPFTKEAVNALRDSGKETFSSEIVITLTIDLRTEAAGKEAALTELHEDLLARLVETLMLPSHVRDYVFDENLEDRIMLIAH